MFFLVPIFYKKKEVEFHKTRFFGVLGEQWWGPQGTGSAKCYSSGNPGVKRGPGPQGTGSSGFPVASLDASENIGWTLLQRQFNHLMVQIAILYSQYFLIDMHHLKNFGKGILMNHRKDLGFKIVLSILKCTHLHIEIYFNDKKYLN